MGEQARVRRLHVLCVIAAIAPFNLVGVRDGGLLLLPLVGFTLIAGTAVAIWSVVATASAGRARRFLLLDGLIAAWILSFWLSVLGSDDMRVSASVAARVCVVAVLAVAAAHTVSEAGDGARLLRCLVAGTLVAVAIGAVVLLAGHEVLATNRFFGGVTRLGPHDRLTRPWSHANVAAMAIGATFAGTALVGSRAVRFAAAATLVVAITFTYSRGAMVALAAGAIAWLVLSRRRDSPALVGIGGLLVLGVAMVLVAPGWSARAAGDEQVSGYRVDIAAPEQVTLGAVNGHASLRIHNASRAKWSPVGEEPVAITARWVEPGTDRVWAEHEWPLPRALGPREQLDVELTLDRRVPVGDYLIFWDLLIEGRAYFRQFAGMAPVTSLGLVTSSPVARPATEHSRLVSPRRFPGRPEIWSAALQAAGSAPILGLGPGRLGETMPANRQVAHAHNLVLEPLSTWGLLATLPFIAVLGLGAWRALRRAWHIRTDSTVARAVAVSIVIVGVHGMVDWPLVHIGVAIPVGLLIGIAWADID